MLVIKQNYIQLLVLLVIIVTVICIVVIISQQRQKVASQYGAVVSNGLSCADIGRDTLRDGGSAVDAAIATLLCEGVMLPHSMGVGGGFVATIYKKSSRQIRTLTAREAAPAAANETMFVGVETLTGAIAGAVPGELLGYYEMHQEYGILPWKELFQPTIKLCSEGHQVSAFLERVLILREKKIREEPSMAEVFVKADGSLYKKGDYLRRPKLAETLREIAEHGAAAMYGGGEVGRKFIEDIKSMGGIMTEEDLKNYRVTWNDEHHVVANVTGGYTLYTTPLPSSGVLLAFILNVMSELYTTHEDVYWQRLVETFKHAFGQRSNLGDLQNETALADAIQSTLRNLSSFDFVEYVRSLIKDNATSTNYSHYGAHFTISEDHGTANIAVLADNGDAVVVTSTINNYFGAKVRSKQTGIILNDEMDDFSTPGLVNGFGVPASPANYIKPGKRPMSSMCPAIILDQHGNVKMLVGAAGGTRITTSVAIAVMKYLILNETLEHAINDGRFHHQLAPMQVDVEMTMPQHTIDYLQNIVGHKVMFTRPGSSFAALTAIGARDVKPEPHYDVRRNGSVALFLRTNKMQH